MGLFGSPSKSAKQSRIQAWRLFFCDDVGFNPSCAIKLEWQQHEKGVARFICVLGEYLSEEVFKDTDQPRITDETLGTSYGGGSLLQSPSRRRCRALKLRGLIFC